VCPKTLLGAAERVFQQGEGLLRFTSSKRYVAALPLTDASANDMWSVNVVVGDEDETFVSDDRPLRSYDDPTVRP